MYCRLFVKTARLGSKGRHGWIKMDTFQFRGKRWRDLGYKSKFYGTNQHRPHSGWTWKGHVGSKNSKKSVDPLVEASSDSVLSWSSRSLCDATFCDLFRMSTACCPIFLCLFVGEPLSPCMDNALHKMWFVFSKSPTQFALSCMYFL